MLRLTDIRLPLDHQPEALAQAVRARLKLGPATEFTVHVARRGFDARKRSAIMLVYSLDVELPGAAGGAVAGSTAAVLAEFSGDPHVRAVPDTAYQPVARANGSGFKRPVVIGCGPCGLFAGLILAEMGFQPIIVERGRSVRERTRDTWGLWRRSVLNPESNVQFGEGGAGTFSDGKLYSQIKDPYHLGRKVLTEFVEAGAPAEILTHSKPHIGTFRLVTMVESMRAKIESLGGEYRFESRVTGLEIEGSGFECRRKARRLTRDHDLFTPGRRWTSESHPFGFSRIGLRRDRP